MSHKCPGPDCSRQVADHMLMCRPHWYQVPRTLRDDVWNAWQNGAGAGSEEHNQAIITAIEAISKTT